MYQNILIAKLYIKYPSHTYILYDQIKYACLWSTAKPYPYMKCLLECVFGGSSWAICIKSTQANAREMMKSNMINFTENIST